MSTDDERAPQDGPSLDDTSTSSESHTAVDGFESTDAPLEPSGEVISGVMDEYDPDATGELDLPGVNEDLNPHPAEADPGFDGWLVDDEASPPSDDPYAALSESDEDDDAASEIADWMAFTNAPADEASIPEEEDDDADVAEAVVPEERTPEAESVDSTEDGPDENLPLATDEDPIDDDPHEDTGAVFSGDAAVEPEDGPADAPAEEPIDTVQDEPADESERVEEIVGGEESLEESDEGDPEKLTVLPIVSIGAGAMESDRAADTDGDEAVVADDDTGEIPIVGFEQPDVASGGGSAIFDGEDFTEEHYLDAATREHHDLAVAVAAADSEDAEQVALSAAIPGLDSGIVGFDDVVDPNAGDASAPIAPPKSSDLVVRVVTGVALVAAFVLSLLWRPAIIVLALAVFVIAAGEFYSVLVHRRYKPLLIFGYLGIIGAGLGAVVWGVIAIPIAFALMITVILLFDAVSQRRDGAVSGFSVTILVAVWVGGFGAFAFPIIAADNYQALVLTVVGMVALVDIAAYLVGRTIGRRPFAPVISPKKTIEGFIGGTLMALLAGAVASFFVEAIDLPAGLALGVVVAVFAPLGDLSVSVIKRSLNIKDMGSILPGHGGALDRIDAIIAVVPAAWAAFVWMGIL
ncbi:MAG: phosphatidate cytidylyltransferase [Actinomycetota bacterium]|nr:phosphatidate cytidylyltransferase [Actinomycetota bacterium]